MQSLETFDGKLCGKSPFFSVNRKHMHMLIHANQHIHAHVHNWSSRQHERKIAVPHYL